MRRITAEQLLRGALQLTVDPDEAASLESQQALLERIQSPLEADYVGLSERGDVDRVGSLVDDRRARECHGLPFADRPQRIAKPRVNEERAVVQTLLEGVVVDHELLVELVEPA